MPLQSLQDGLLGLQTDKAIYFSTIFQNKQSRNALNLKMSCRHWVVIDIEFTN